MPVQAGLRRGGPGQVRLARPGQPGGPGPLRQAGAAGPDHLAGQAVTLSLKANFLTSAGGGPQYFAPTHMQPLGAALESIPPATGQGHFGAFTILWAADLGKQANA